MGGRWEEGGRGGTVRRGFETGQRAEVGRIDEEEEA